MLYSLAIDSLVGRVCSYHRDLEEKYQVMETYGGVELYSINIRTPKLNLRRNLHFRPPYTTY
jgi:hypothetical protein